MEVHNIFRAFARLQTRDQHTHRQSANIACLKFRYIGHVLHNQCSLLFDCGILIQPFVHGNQCSCKALRMARRKIRCTLEDRMKRNGFGNIAPIRVLYKCAHPFPFHFPHEIGSVMRIVQRDPSWVPFSTCAFHGNSFAEYIKQWQNLWMRVCLRYTNHRICVQKCANVSIRRVGMILTMQDPVM